MYYHPNPNADYSVLYPEFKNVKVSEQVEDVRGNLLIIPEIQTIPDARKHFPNCTIAIYWLSFTNAAIFGSLKANLQAESQAIHLFHSYYEYVMIRPYLSWNTWWFFLTDYIHDEYTDLDPESFVEDKEDLVCFNPTKDRITPHICEKLDVPLIPIRGMTREQVMETLRKCKLYVDNGYHPGKDHLPREAAMHGCVVITNKSGSAAYWEDVPIEEKIVQEVDLYDLIPDVMANYRHYFDKQDHYRQVIRSEKEAFQINANNFWRSISTTMPPPEGW